MSLILVAEENLECLFCRKRIDTLNVRLCLLCLFFFSDS